MQVTTHLASELLPKQQRRGEDYLIALSHHLSATHYLNATGGQALYDPQIFAAQGIVLEFLSPENFSYPQFSAPFVPALSIIDV